METCPQCCSQGDVGARHGSIKRMKQSKAKKVKSHVFGFKNKNKDVTVITCIVGL